MKRDVKVGLFVAAVVCSVAAILLGGGLSARAPERPPALSLDGGAGEETSDRREAALRDGPSASVPADLTEGIEPPDEPADAAADSLGAVAGAETAPAGVDEFDARLAEETAGAFAGDEWASVDEGDEVIDETPEDPDAAVTTAGEDVIPSPDGGAGAPGDFEEPSIPVGEEEVAGAAFEEDEPAPRHEPKRLYVVKEGESFWTITKKLYGAGKYHADVVKANPDVDPGRVRAGQVIAIPEIEDAVLHEEFLATPEELEPRSRRARVYLARDERHVIQAGETLGDIAEKYYKSAIKWPHILRANPEVDPRRLRAGKTIVVPALTEPPGRPKLPDAPRERARRPAREPKVYLAEATTHVIEFGDTLESISRRYYGVRHQWDHILAKNPALDAGRLKPGEEIVIPALTE